MFLNTASATHRPRKSLDPGRRARTVASATTATLINQARRIRVGHVSFVLGLALAMAAAVSLGAFESGAAPARPQVSHQATHGVAVSKVWDAPVNFVLIDSQDEANALLAESYYLQTEAFGSVALPTVRVIGSAEDDQQFQDELDWIGFEGVDYRVTDLRAK